MITSFKLYEATTEFWYKGFKCIKNLEKTPGEYGLWYIPELYYRKFGNKIEKGFETVSMIQCREAIDKWYNFSINVSKNIE
jgi:hypothetical protein